MKDKIKLDLPTRIEKRYIIPSPQKFLDRISPYVERKRFSNNEYVQTIYFNNNEHVVPFEFSIKARRYLPTLPDYPFLDKGTYFLDLKKGKGENKQKVRLEATLEEATKIVNKKYAFSEIPLRPYILVEYLRRHYTPKKLGDIRLTLDTGMRYFFFPPNQKEGIMIGREDGYTRLEIKEGEPNENFTNLMRKVLKEINAFPIISKKFTAYDFLGLYRAKTSGKPFSKELKDYEIESKLETESEEIFQEIKQFFKEGMSNFKLPAHFPYTFESASINRYYKNEKGLFKAMLRKNEVEIVKKSDIEVINDPFGLNCILKRKEIKGNIVPIDSEMIISAKLQGELYRMRKAFWVENGETNRFYHISLDCCLGLPGTLYEVEVEYTGRYTKSERTKIGKKTEGEIIKDIANITKILITNFPSLRPSQLTKQDWLGVE